MWITKISPPLSNYSQKYGEQKNTPFERELHERFTNFVSYYRGLAITYFVTRPSPVFCNIPFSLASFKSLLAVAVDISLK